MVQWQLLVNRASVFFVVTLAMGAPALIVSKADEEKRQVCREAVYTAMLGVSLQSSLSTARRVEVRRCADDKARVLQLVAWPEGAVEPSIVENSDRFAISQAYMFNDVVAIEFGGGSTNILFVVTFHNGKPRLAYREAYKAYAMFFTDRLKILIKLPIADEKIYTIELPTGIR